MTTEYGYLLDGHGDVAALVTPAGELVLDYAYDPFGSETGYQPDNADQWDNPFRYCGEYWDGETETYYLRARQYDPETGRFLSEDPYWNIYNMVYSEGSDSPSILAISQSRNLYAFCINNPILYIDDDGEWVHIAVGALVGAGAGIVSYLIASALSGEERTLSGFVTSAVSGGFAASGVGIVGQIIANGIIGGGTNIIKQVWDKGSFKRINPWEVATNVVTGLVAGALGGPGANSNHYLDSLSNQLLKRMGKAFKYKHGAALIDELAGAISYYIKSSKTITVEMAEGIITSNVPAVAVGGAQGMEKLIEEVEERCGLIFCAPPV